MRREAFLAFLVTRYRGLRGGGPLGDGSAKSYCANLARAEVALQVDFDRIDLSIAGLDDVGRQLRASALPTAKIGDCVSAIQAYAQFLDDKPAAGPTKPRKTPPGLAPTRAGSESAPAPASHQPDPLIAHMSVKGLLAMHGAIMHELRHRGIVRTSNNPVADYAETLFARAFGWKLENSSALGFDAVDAEGLRYQIKGRRITRFNGSRQLSAIRRLEQLPFDFLAGVLFNDDYTVLRAIILPHRFVQPNAKFRSHTNSWVFLLEDRVWRLEGARDVTGEIASAAESLG